MTAGIVKNFRGLRALVVQQRDANRDALLAILAKLGLEAAVIEPGSDPPPDLTFDLLFFDADDGTGGVFDDGDPPDAACIALVGSEAPSRLSRLLRHNAASHIQKPIRSTGVFTAIFIAVNDYRRRRKTAREIEGLRARLAGRRVLTKAVLHLMRLCDIDEDEAYERLRSESMHRRIPIEEMARESLGQDRKAHDTMRRAQISRKA